MAAELRGARLERHPGAQAGLLEEHRQGPPGEGRLGVAVAGPELGLEVGGEVEEPLDLGARQVGDAEQIASSQGARASTSAWRSCRADGSD